jgi:broad specificity phosphatase PhoE
LGREQVAALAEALGRRRMERARVVSGSLRRQLDTAAPLAATTGREVVVDPRWNEYESHEVLPSHAPAGVRLEHDPDDPTPVLPSRDFQVALDDALSAWIAADRRSPAAQTWPDFLAQGTAALHDLAGNLEPGETALVFTSGGVIAAICVALLGLPAQAFVAFNRVSVNTGITKIVHGRSGTTLVSFNEHAHLDERDAGLLTYR